jgi:hypothetical protein
MIIDMLQPAASAADRITAAAGRLQRTIDSARRGALLDISTDELERELGLLKKALPRRRKAVLRVA